MGSQKYGAFWTGDNMAVDLELENGLKMILSMGMSGFGFGGTDIPGFFGYPTQDMFEISYEIGSFYPFFRAHSHEFSQKREPWLQSKQV